MCSGCREMKPKNELIRVVRTPEGKIVIVVTNEGHDRTITVPTLSLKMTVYTTDSEHSFEQTYSGLNKGIVSVKADSINTIVLG